MLVHRLVTSPDAAKYLPFGESKLRQLVDLFGGTPFVKNYVLEDATITVEVYSRDSGSVTVEGGFAYITIGTEVNPPSYVAKAQASFKRKFKRFKSVFLNPEAGDASKTNVPGLIPVTGFQSVALQLARGSTVDLYRVKKGGSSKLVLSTTYGAQPLAIGTGVVGAFTLAGKLLWHVYSLDYYYEVPGDAFFRAVFSRSSDAGDTFLPPVAPVTLDFGGNADQYIGQPEFLGNSVINFYSGYQPRSGFTRPDEPVLFRTGDGAVNWDIYTAPYLFAWMPVVLSNAVRSNAYQDVVRFAEPFPVGNNVILMMIFRSLGGGSGSSAALHKSTDNGLSFDNGTVIGTDWASTAPLGVGAAAIVTENSGAFSVMLTNDFGATWINRPAPFAQFVEYTLIKTPVKTDDGKIDLDKLHIIAPFYDTDGYYVYYTIDGAQTWTKGGLIARTAVSPAVLGKANFNQVTALSRNGSFAFSNLYDNAGAPLA